MDNIQEMKNKWNDKSVPGYFNHTDTDVKPLNDVYEKYVDVLSGIDFNDKTIIDYGCGGAWLGKYLLSKYTIKKYIGYDISERSLSFADENLKEFENVKLVNVKNIPSFKSQHADVFVSLFCLQHFPELQYTKDFLKKLNESEIKYLIIQFRIAENNKLKFIPNGYNKIWISTFPKNSLNEHLSNYEMIVAENSKMKNKTDYLRFVVFQRRENVQE